MTRWHRFVVRCLFSAAFTWGLVGHVGLWDRSWVEWGLMWCVVVVALQLSASVASRWWYGVLFYYQAGIGGDRRRVGRSFVFECRVQEWEALWVMERIEAVSHRQVMKLMTVLGQDRKQAKAGGRDDGSASRRV